MSVERCITVYDKDGKKLSPCSRKVAWVLLNRKRAVEIAEDAIQILLDKKDLKMIRNIVIERDNRTCFYCGEVIPEDEIVTVDHLDPKHIKEDGTCGLDDEENMACACLKCNNHKGNMTAEEYILLRFSILMAFICFKTNQSIEEVLMIE